MHENRVFLQLWSVISGAQQCPKLDSFVSSPLKSPRHWKIRRIWNPRIPKTGGEHASMHLLLHLYVLHVQLGEGMFGTCPEHI